ncbi:MAG: translation initiation factor IF-2 [Pleurocapsa sp.]
MNNGKVRIYELSKELNLDNKDIKDICEQLNIAVKSHSSTITEAQAERVRAASAKYVPSESTNDMAKDSKDHKPQGKRKQQILAIHHKTNSSNSTAQATKPEPPNSPTLTSSPSLNKPKSPKTDNLSSESTVQLKSPPARESQKATAEFKSAQDKSSHTPTVQETDSASETETPTPQPVAKPSKLVNPPSRPQPNKPPNRKAGAKSPVKPVKIRSAKPQETQAKPEDSEVSKVAAKVQLPKLQKPPKPQSISKPPEEDIEETPVDLVEEEDGSDNSELIRKNDTRPTRLKRPTPPRKVQEWEDEDEDEQKSKSGKGKIGAKKPRRLKPVIDDEDDFEAEIDSVAVSTAFSLSTARPPKPKSLQGQKPAASGSKKPRKPSPRTEKTPKVERQSRKAIVETVPEIITLSDNLTVRELADRLKTPETDIIRDLFAKGIAVNITQTLDLETARLVAEELGVMVEIPEARSAAVKETDMLDVNDLENLQLRPPVVTIMGHVDHGKTTLLDSIRKSKVAQGEAGGITQHIGAYHVDVEHNGANQQIVFLDTPGHEAFTAMRARGTRVTDIAILVVAADDGVQPQTREAISHAKAAEVPIIVAINKVDKPEANPDRIKQELTEHQLVPEDWGGDTTMVEVSALKGDNLDELLEMILLVAEVEELSANPDRPAKGTIIEAHLDRNRGPVATLLVQNGTLRVGDSIVAGSVLGKIRAMIDDRGEKVEAATPSFAVEILGLNDVPEAGDEFDVYPNEKEARGVADKRSIQHRDSRLQQSMSSRRVSLSTLSAQAQEGELKELNLIIKADVQGSVEAILGSLQQLPQNEVQLRVLLAAPGEVTETDVDLAAASGAVIIGFNTTLATGARQAAEREAVDVRQYNIIYKLLDEIQGAMEGLLDPEEVEETLGQAEVRAVFPVGRGAVAGCYVLSGKIVRNCQMRVLRGNKVVYQGDLNSLKRMKEDAKEVNAGYECGIGSAKFNDWQEKDIIEAYEMSFKRRTLASAK